ncbi:RHO1 GDP-GTP exchange protein 2, partial [Rhizopus stolonifer]
QRITLSDHIKDDIEYKNSFDGKEIVDKIALITQTSDRKLALRIGKALSEQRFFHDVSYETQLIDSSIYIYEFTSRNFYSSQPNGSDSWSENESQEGFEHDTSNFPNGIITELTHCYVPTCWDIRPCYSPTCPKRLQVLSLYNQQVISWVLFCEHFLFQIKYIENEEEGMLVQKPSSPTSFLHNDLWADNVDQETYFSLPKTERKRQENLYELIYTEKDYVQSLDYLLNMWIRPLTERPIIPASRKESFVRKVFGNVEDIYRINSRLLHALQLRQSQQAVVHRIGDILLEYVIEFEPYISYGSKQYEAKFALENERYINPNFDAFVTTTERHPSSLKLELNGYLTKPTTRLGRYTLLLNEILKHTPPDHPDLEDLPKAVTIIKRFLSRVNAETGKAKNRFDLERIHYNLSFKYKADEMNLDLLDKSRSIIKQGTLKKSPQIDSVEYQVILFDHYLIIAKLKISNGTERYIIQRRVKLLHVYLPDTAISQNKRSSTLALLSPTAPGTHIRASIDIGSQLNSANSTSINGNKTIHYPIAFQHLGRNTLKQYILYTTSHATRKPWVEKIREQQEEKNKKSPIFELFPVIPEHTFKESNRINHFITFNGGQQYLLATDDGVYVGHHNDRHTDTTPHKVLLLEKVTQIQAIEGTGTLLVLADKTLWEYPLDVVNGKPETQPSGRFVQSNAPFFYTGICLKKMMVCVPKISTLRSVITVFEAVKRSEGGNNTTSITKTTTSRRSSHMLDRLLSIRTLAQPSDDLHLKKLKDTYVPCEAYAVELSASMMLITSSRGMIMIDMRTDQPQQLLNPGDRNLAFILEREREVSSSLHLRQPIRHIAIFRTPRNHYFMCYDEYAFYIDSKGNRLFTKFLIEWEGAPESFAFCYPFVLAFDSSFIEVRNVVTGAIEQIIRGKHMRCLNNGHKTELSLIFGSKIDSMNENYQSIFEIRLVAEPFITVGVEPSTLN